jgi:hypothetical protein
MSAVQNNSEQKGRLPQTNATPVKAPVKLQAPLRIHFYVWVFMIILGVSPLLYILGVRGYFESRDRLGTGIAVVLIQGMFWFAQRRCSTEDLTYWEGLLVAAASVETGSYFISLPLSFFVLLYTSAASFLFALLHDPRSPTRHAQLCFGKMIIAIHRRRLYRSRD